MREGADESGQVCSAGRGGVGGGDGKDSVDYMDDTTSKVDILGVLVRKDMEVWGAGKVEGTYSGDNSALGQQPAEDLHARAIKTCLNTLATGHIRICLVCQKGRQELRRVREC